ncbi:MAG: hypothetical protein R2827_05605 [Bdellovibrionales bacterium]
MKFLFLFLVVCSSVTSIAKTCPFEGTSAKPHAIFLIHGLLAEGTDTFGDLQEILENTYAKSCLKNIRVHQIEYFSNPNSSGGILNFHRVQTMHPYDFAKVAYAEMKSFLLKEREKDRIEGVPTENQFGLDTPYTLIAHSQGGITSMSVLQSCIYSAINDNDTEHRCDYNDVIGEFDKLAGQFDENGSSEPHPKWNEQRLLNNFIWIQRSFSPKFKLIQEKCTRTLRM